MSGQASTDVVSGIRDGSVWNGDAKAHSAALDALVARQVPLDEAAHVPDDIRAYVARKHSGVNPLATVPDGDLGDTDEAAAERCRRLFIGWAREAGIDRVRWTMRVGGGMEADVAAYADHQAVGLLRLQALIRVKHRNEPDWDPGIPDEFAGGTLLRQVRDPSTGYRTRGMFGASWKDYGRLSGAAQGKFEGHVLRMVAVSQARRTAQVAALNRKLHDRPLPTPQEGADHLRSASPADPRQQAPSPDSPFALSEEQGRTEAGAAFIAMADINSAAERWTDPGDMPGKIAVFAMGGMVAQGDWDSLATALAALLDAFAGSSPRLAAFIERDARTSAMRATQLGMPFGASQQSGSRALESSIADFHGAFRNEFISICRHTIAVEPGQERIAPASIRQRVRPDAVAEWHRAFVLFDRAIIEANQPPAPDPDQGTIDDRSPVRDGGAPDGSSDQGTSASEHASSQGVGPADIAGRTYDEVIAGVKAALTGDFQHDGALITSVGQSCGGHPQAKEIRRELGRMLAAIAPDDVKAKFDGIVDGYESGFEPGLAAARARISAGHVAEARAVLEDLILRYGTGTGLYQDDSVSQYRRFGNDFEAALYARLYPSTKTLRKLPQDRATLYSLYGAVLLEQRDADGAEAALRDALRANPVSTDAMFELGEVMKLTGRKRECRELTLRALEVAYTGRRSDVVTATSATSRSTTAISTSP